MNPLFLTVLIATHVSPPRIALIKHHRLYVLDCQASGVPERGAKPYLVCNVGTESELEWTPRGEIQVGDKLNASLLITPRRGKSIVRKFPEDQFRFEIAHVESRIPSPTGSSEIVLWTYTSGNSIWHTDAYIVDRKRHTKKLLAPSIDGIPEWSPKGDLIALVRFEEPGGGSPELVKYPSLKVKLKLDTVVNSWWNKFSPDGRWISRAGGPLEFRRTELLNVRTGQSVDTEGLEGYQTHYIDEWSPDGRHFLESYGAQDDREYWTKSVYAIGDVVTRKTKRIPGSERAAAVHYSKDGRHLLWYSKSSDELLAVDVERPSHRRILAYDVASFAPSWL